ncbi:DUF1998 domain-containing protein [Streptomyces sp. Ru72]|uniref:DUF1998 domain-containing protein n=1 Tax=Streptomyces sp. Ru72 TaxID=2080747 RepID=UPI000CDDAF3E|nr:DUF1998 domain-containing protein [Streptomyces sp. Ru72]POX44526.1 hypothetical protein C3488_32595 [Streptomyces sp. Ru72]
MTPPPARRRRGAPAAAIRPRKLGTVRRAQMITTYGVGALVAVDNESFIVGDLASWDLREAPELSEKRLARILKVDHFRQPPAPDPDRGVDGVRVRRFPEWYSCPSCHELQPYFKFNAPPGRATCGDCSEDLVPSRFVLACDNGHLADFPYWKWVHRGSGHAGGLCGGKLRLTTKGDTGSLRSIIVSCSCGVPEVSMEGAFRTRVIQDLGIRCEATRAWLKDAPADSCALTPRAMQRGSSALWHPIVASALSIPPWGEGAHAVVERERLHGASEDYVREHFRRRPYLLDKTGLSVEEILSVIRAIEEADRLAGDDDTPLAKAHTTLRQEEYQRLRHGNPERYDAEWQPFVCEPPEAPQSHALAAAGVESPMLVKRLREVRALSSFSRGAAPSPADSDRRRAPLTLSPAVNWLPAIEVKGEGVFLRLDQQRLGEWENESAVVARSERIRRNHLALLADRARSAGTDPQAAQDSPVSPRFLLLHTLAHVLINEWSLDGGYPAAALRERVYAGEDMAGILLYTATSDSAGSLGGIVAQGEPSRLEHTLRSAVARAAWCSNDPLCMESEASGADSVNLAACHACLLLPETSCETNNAFLDRGLLIDGVTGTPGFFAADARW